MAATEMFGKLKSLLERFNARMPRKRELACSEPESSSCPRSSFEEETDVAFYGRTPYTAWEHALSRGKHHPKLWEMVKGSPFEALYRSRFNLQEDAPCADKAR